MENIWSLLGVLFVVILILFLAYWVTRWIAIHGSPGGGISPLPGDGGALRLLAQLPVGRNERLVLARLNQRCYLLGVTEHNITLLRELEGEEAEPWLAAGEHSSAQSFLEVLSGNLRKK